MYPFALMAQRPRMIIGLGNPGVEYADTRHNVGHWVVDALAEQLDVMLERDRANALTAFGTVRGRRMGLAVPLTYMNLSGEAVKGLIRQYNLTPDDLLIVYDDLNLEPGDVRLRPGGSAGGHNGLQSVIDHLGTDAVARLRIGIGRDFPRGRQSDYVLSPFSDEQQPLVDEAVEVARKASVEFVTRGIESAMNRYNRRAS